MFRVLAILLVAVPSVALAAVDFGGPIVPNCGLDVSGFMCQACHLAALTHNILVFLIALAVGASAIMFAYAGFLYVTAAANHGNIDSAKRIFGQVFIGLVLVLCAWLVVDLALRVFTGQSLQVLTQFQCVKADLVSGSFTFPETPVDVAVTTPPASVAQCAAGTGLTHQAALDRLKATGKITVTSTSGAGGVRAGCSGKGCTTLTNICDGTVKGLTDIAKDSPCGGITVWGASEGGDAHTGTTHKTGCAFDISPNNGDFSCLGNFLKQNSAKYGITQLCTPSKYDTYTFGCGTFREGNDHYHVTFCKR